MDYPDPVLRSCCRVWIVLGAASIPLSIVAAQLFFYLTVAVWLGHVLWHRRWEVFTGNHLSIYVALFFGACAMSAVWGLHHLYAASKLYRLSFLLLIFAVPDLFHGRRRQVWWVFGAFVASTLVLSIHDAVRVPQEVASLEEPDMAHTGNMRDPQFYMVATVWLLVSMLTLRDRALALLCVAPIGLCLMGLFLHSKMGSFLGLACALAGMVWLFRRAKVIALVGVVGVIVALGLVAHDVTRERIVHKVNNEFNPEYGARGTLWGVVAPGFIKDNFLYGAGYKSTNYDDLVQYKGPHHMEVGLEHLHNNLLQVQAELGVLGPLTWVPWMAIVFVGMWRSRGSPMGVMVLLGFLALFMNGMMEYNFGDSEPFMLFNLVMGLSGLSPAKPD